MTDNVAAKATDPSRKIPLFVKVTVEGPDTKVVRQVSDATALDVIQLIMGGKERQKSPDNSESDSGGAATGTDESKLSIGEYLADRNAQSSAEKITAIGWHLTKGKSNTSFSLVDIIAQLDLARETKPKNLTRDIKETVRKNWLTDSAPGRYVVTRTGEKAVKDKFGRIEVTPSTPKARRRKKTANMKKPKKATSAK